MNKLMILPLILISFSVFGQNWKNDHWIADNGNGTYTNPILHSDYSDPDVCRAGDYFYMTASSFNCVPGLPVLRSSDLVNWELIAHALPELYHPMFEQPQHGNGVWAPAIRFHNNEFFIYWGDPDLGIYMVKAQNPEGPWSKAHLVHSAKGWIDPCPFWDEDGKAYLVHAYAGSRSGIKSILVMNEMSPDGMSIDPQPVLVFDGQEKHITIEGPKLYKRNGFYYIFAPAGGVKPGWQTILRSKNIYGPYKDKVVLHQGNTTLNGPHQGGFIELESGESWFIHFQDKDAYGRIVHLQPVNWVNNWPLMGTGINNEGMIGEPVHTYQKPKVKVKSEPLGIPTSDEFNTTKLGLQWQWHATPQTEWAFTSPYGYLRMNCITNPPGELNFWELPNLLLQKLPSEEFTTTTKFTFYPKEDGDRAGLIMMGEDYAYLACESNEGKKYITFNICSNARTEGKENQIDKIEIQGNDVYFRIEVKAGAICQFSFSTDGTNFQQLDAKFSARAGRWIGAKVGIFALKTKTTNDSGYAHFDWFRFE
jgi:beta-xylosidase